MQKIKHVQQDDDKSCTLACIAMVTGASYAELKKNVMQVPVPHSEVDRLLYANGMYPLRSVYTTLFAGKTYIVAVPSLNFKGGMHSIVVQTGETPEDPFVILDPQEGREGREFYTLENLISWEGPIECKPI
jgi:hypothetical protein